MSLKDFSKEKEGPKMNLHPNWEMVLEMVPNSGKNLAPPLVAG